MAVFFHRHLILHGRLAPVSGSGMAGLLEQPPEYVIGVWTGNADGEGRPGLTGISAAAPLLFDLFNLLGYKGWFRTPDEDLTIISVFAV